MAFDPTAHYANCTGAVTQMIAIAQSGAGGLIRDTTQWNALSTYITNIGTGAASALADINSLGAAKNYNAAYLSMLSLAPVILGAEEADLATTPVFQCAAGFDTVRLYANSIRDPFNMGTFAVLASIPQPTEANPSMAMSLPDAGMSRALAAVSAELGRLVAMA